MGSCGTKVKKVESSVKLSKVPSKGPSNYIIKIIQPSLFYNLVAKDFNREVKNELKNNEYIDFRERRHFQTDHLKFAMNIDYQSIKENKEDLFKSLKIFLDFKNLVIVGENLVSDNSLSEDLLEFFFMLESAKISLNRVYILAGSIMETLSQFPFFSFKTESQTEEKSLPLVLYSEHDKILLSKNNIIVPSKFEKTSSQSQENIRILCFETGTIVYVQDYSRFQQSYDEQFYSEKLGVKDVLVTFKNVQLSDLKIGATSGSSMGRPGTASSQKKINVISEDLSNTNEIQSLFKKFFNQKSSFLLVHETKQAEPTMNALIAFLETRIKINPESLRSYIEERFPKLTVQEQTSPKKSLKLKTPQKESSFHKNQEEVILTRVEQITELMLDLKKASKNNPNSFQEIYALLGRIVDNIIKNPQEDKYRSLNGNNPKLKQSLFKYNESQKLVEITGFVRNETGAEIQYINSLDVNSLKHIKIDIDLGYKNASSQS